MKKFITIIFILLLLPALAHRPEYKPSPKADTSPLNMALRYEAYWSGISVGEMKIYLKTENDKYDYTVRLDSAGFTKMITKYWSENRAVGGISGGKYIPQKYYTEWRLKKEHQKIQVNYDAEGNAILEIADPPENRGKRELVALKDKKDSYDTVTAAIVAREKIIEAVEGGEKFPMKFTIPLFDARRKQIIDLTIPGYETKMIGGKKQKVLHVNFRRIPGAGFRAKELRRMETQEPVYDIYLDDRYIPLLVVGKAPVGTATILLQEICETADCNFRKD